MTERYGGYGAEPHPHPRIHKISVTRSCLTSGTLQLPFALWDSLPEGDLLMHDVHEDASVPVRSDPPRRLSGLRGFFERHEVGVNDRLVLQFDDDATVRVQIEVVSRPAPRHTGEPDQAETNGQGAPRPSTEVPAEKRVAAAPAQMDVVDRFGRVTVRRLGAGRGREVPPPSVPARVPAPRKERATHQRPEGSRVQVSRSEAAPPERGGVEPAAPEARGEASASPVARDPRLASPERRDEEPAAAPAEAPAEAADQAPPEARRAHLNARGDLRTQVVRYLLRPETPVILRVEVIAERFSLEPSVARDVMAGIAQDPPPSLAVEAVREDMYRVARVTVEQDA